MPLEVIIIGSGFSGLASSIILANAGYKVKVFEKNSSPGGRARSLEYNGFKFDMGPTWYWMPDVFEKFFNRFNTTPSNFYELIRLNPSYRVYFAENDYVDLPVELAQIIELFNKIEPGSSQKFLKFLSEAEKKYNLSVNKFIYYPNLALSEYLNKEFLLNVLKLNLFSSFQRYLRKNFKSEKIIAILRFPLIFLGGNPEELPALYSIMNYADIKLGTWYPKGGFKSVVDSLYKLAISAGVQFNFEAPVQKIIVRGNKVNGVIVDKEKIKADIVIATSDYHHSESLLDIEYRNYPPKYWESRVYTPSGILFYVGLKKKLPKLPHHILFFDENFEAHINSIYKKPEFPPKPQIYVNLPSQTEPELAPEGKECIYFFIPLAPGLKEDEEIKQRYFNFAIEKFENLVGEKIKDSIEFFISYGPSDFMKDYNAYKGNCYGLANTLFQTAIFKPKIRNRKIKNLFYAGHTTVPGPGVPPSIISGTIVSDFIIKNKDEI
ncbi:phytoene desaturase [Candidatus Kryptobacter tengchongensis]|uniref:Phytoene desaturase n=1 Tax=Kryptobacter tengchongensis TaxID=1643429 RepID=A0A916LKU9_KRYT1|nr:phytoene desaturase family protein [Candidatus Kryptobacter tengchongensis]CUT05129.1 phytoene desaturase [Candidatus Kryptobacter tengchongensis]CUU06374.1 phytoene desaturase [Candidatus Kryptobacter tengchongensis]